MKYANPWAEAESKFHPVKEQQIKMTPMERWRCENDPFYNPYKKDR